jgi:hypothetical protein
LSIRFKEKLVKYTAIIQEDKLIVYASLTLYNELNKIKLCQSLAILFNDFNTFTSKVILIDHSIYHIPKMKTLHSKKKKQKQKKTTKNQTTHLKNFVFTVTLLTFTTT